jgi:hypothetical protein
MTHAFERFFKFSYLLLLMMACMAVLNGSCQRSSSEGKKVDPVSQTPPKLEPLPRTAPVLARATPVPSQGDCAPRYANGLHGTCINNQPCRGFGQLGPDGRPVCACYAKAGGCNEGQRCDVMKKACVPEKEPGFGRAPGR